MSEIRLSSSEIAPPRVCRASPNVEIAEPHNAILAPVFDELSLFCDPLLNTELFPSKLSPLDHIN